MGSDSNGWGAGAAERAGPSPAASRPRRVWRSVALLGSFVVVAMTVELGWWSGLDHAADRWAARQRGTSLWEVSKVVVDVATPQVSLPIALALAVLMGWRRHRWAIAWEAAFRIALVVVSVLLVKPLLAVPGPTQHSFGDHGGAFPSGHTTSTVIFMAVVLAWAPTRRWVVGSLVVGAAVVLVVGVAVVCVRYHYVSDVVGGVLLGLLIATVPVRHLRRHGLDMGP